MQRWFRTRVRETPFEGTKDAWQGRHARPLTSCKFSATWQGILSCVSWLLGMYTASSNFERSSMKIISAEGSSFELLQFLLIVMWFVKVLLVRAACVAPSEASAISTQEQWRYYREIFAAWLIGFSVIIRLTIQCILWCLIFTTRLQVCIIENSLLHAKRFYGANFVKAHTLTCHVYHGDS